MPPFGDNFVRKNSEGYGSSNSINEDLAELSLTEKELEKERKIFVNKNLNLSKITCYGFDMDYTLCEYISPQFDELACELAKTWMVDNLGYPKEILDIQYNHQFGVRGLWFDRKAGNLLKVDQFGKILECLHGFRMLKSEEIKAIYPNKIQRKDDARVFVMNTLFNLAETFLIAALVDYFNKREDYEGLVDGWMKEGEEFTFAQLFKDLRAAIDDMHLHSCLLKKGCLANLPKYVKKDDRLPSMLEKIRKSGRKTFLVTNSDWWYSSQIMNFLLGGSWLSYFDLVVVDACKPRFFSTGTALQRVDTTSSTFTLLPLSSCPPGPTVYSGGDHSTISRMLGARGPDVIYVGDHLYADVIKCRKECLWRTMLIVPELAHELQVTHKNSGLLSHLTKLESLLAENPKLEELKVRLWEAVNELNQYFSGSGSVFRSGSRLSFFGSQVMIWADVYTASVNNLAEYSIEHKFVMNTAKLPHETGIEMTRECSEEQDTSEDQELDSIQEVEEEDFHDEDICAY
jgi:5'-nucleotidase